ncbi:amidohydrolase family protein [Aliiroseovarius sp.]|uniref:amidohydrolase family protein n=1 Tax=Aliiroseovarius sp. TaxID=1872442 RepID=UPI003BAA2E26
MAHAEAATPEELFMFCTQNGARVLGIEDTAGSIEVGTSAVLLVLNQNVFTVNPDKFTETFPVQVCLHR